MNKSFAARLAALEAIEAEAQQARMPLSIDDRDLLIAAITDQRVGMDAARRLMYHGVGSPALDLALLRCNTVLVALAPPHTTLEDIDAWLRALPDVDSFDEDELIAEALTGLIRLEGLEPGVMFTGGVLRAFHVSPLSLRRYWGAVAERAAPLIQAQGISFFPLFPDLIHAALAQLDTGVITCCAYPGATSHHSTVLTSAPPSLDPKRNSLHTCLIWALDQYQAQTGDPLIETADQLRTLLVEALEQFRHEESIETA